MIYQDQWTKEHLSTCDKQLVVAVDHGLSFPNMPGLENPFEILKKVAINPAVDGIIATPGIYRQAERQHVDLSKFNRLIPLNCVKQEGNHIVEHEIVITPDEAMTCQPDCFKFFFNIYQDNAELMRNLLDISLIANDAHRLGVSSLAEIMFWNNDEYLDPARQEYLLYEGCRMAMEVGIDVLRVSAALVPDSMNKLIDQIQLPTFIIGGSKNVTPEDFLDDVVQMKKMNICGVMFGRNIWQSANVDYTINSIHCIFKSNMKSQERLKE